MTPWLSDASRKERSVDSKPTIDPEFTLTPGQRKTLAGATRTLEMPERRQLTFADVEVLEAAGLYDLAVVARKYLRPRRRWYRLWRFSREQQELLEKLR